MYEAGVARGVLISIFFKMSVVLQTRTQGQSLGEDFFSLSS